jgi:hypothetical protein
MGAQKCSLIAVRLPVTLGLVTGVLTRHEPFSEIRELGCEACRNMIT